MSNKDSAAAPVAKEVSKEVASGKDGKAKTESKVRRTSKANKAGVSLLPRRVARRLKPILSGKQMSDAALIFMTAGIERIFKEVFDGAETSLRQDNRTRLQPKDIQHSLRNNAELSEVFTGTIPRADHMPGQYY